MLRLRSGGHTKPPRTSSCQKVELPRNTNFESLCNVNLYSKIKIKYLNFIVPKYILIKVKKIIFIGLLGQEFPPVALAFAESRSILA